LFRSRRSSKKINEEEDPFDSYDEEDKPKNKRKTKIPEKPKKPLKTQPKKLADKPADKVADKPVEKPVDKSVNKPADKPVDKPAEQSVNLEDSSKEESLEVTQTSQESNRSGALPSDPNLTAQQLKLGAIFKKYFGLDPKSHIQQIDVDKVIQGGWRQVRRDGVEKIKQSIIKNDVLPLFD